MIEEVIINEIEDDGPPGLLKIKHDAPTPKDIEIELPLSNLKMNEFQEQNPLVRRIRKQWFEKKLDRKNLTVEKEILK